MWAEDTNIPDPALLPEAPPLYRRLPRLCAWIFREPLAALVHAVAFACCLVALFALLRPLLARSRAFGYALRVVLSFLTIRLLGTLFARYLLYQFALVYAFHRETTLRDMTMARLQFRSNRGSALFGIVVAVLGLFLLRGIAADGAPQSASVPSAAMPRRRNKPRTATTIPNSAEPRLLRNCSRAMVRSRSVVSRWNA